MVAAHLAAEAMADLYEDVGHEAVEVLSREFLINGSELGDAAVLLDKDVCGLIAAYPAREYQSRQRVSLHHALGSLSPEGGKKLISALRRLADQIPQGRIEGAYIARFAVRADLRGSGTANRMLEQFLSDQKTVSLHVRADNSRAIAFYRRHGFIESDGAGTHLLMSRI